MTAVYLDTSAYLGIVLHQPSARKITALLRQTRLYSSVLLIIEAARTFLRLTREGHISIEQHLALRNRLVQDIQIFSLRDVDRTLVLDMSFPAAGLPRTLDLIHLRTAQFFQKQQPDLIFVTLDKKQALAAQEIGLVVP